MNSRRNFLKGLLTAAAGFTILPPATTYGRIWRAETVPPLDIRALMTLVYKIRRDRDGVDRIDVLTDRETAEHLKVIYTSIGYSSDKIIELERSYTYVETGVWQAIQT